MSDWQDATLKVPYGVEIGKTDVRMQLLRQDFEQLERNQSVIRTPLKIGSQSFQHGLGTHSFSHIRLLSREPIVRFVAKVGVDNNARTQSSGSVGFAVQASGRDLFRSPKLVSGQEPLTVDLTTQEVFSLDLLVDDGSDGPGCDHADWCDASITLKNGKTLRLDELPLQQGNGRAYPFSFQYGGRDSDALLPTWTTHSETVKVDADQTRQTTTWQDPQSGLKITWEATRFSAFPALDWVLYVENTGKTDTDIVENLQALDYSFESGGPFTLHKTHGSAANAHDFQPDLVSLTPQKPDISVGGQGKSSYEWFPFFKVDHSQGALMLAVGWSGQWKTVISTAGAKAFQMTAGLELTHFHLHPGEKVRSPRILLLNHKGESVEANVQFRRLIQKHYMAKRDGQTPLPIPFCNTCFTRGGLWLNECTAENQISLIKAYAKLGLEALLTDAGWFEGGWPDGAGNWNPRKDAYPQGMAPVAKAAKDNKMIYGLWFEPERVVSGTTFHKEHPEWVLSNGVPGDMTLAANFGLKPVQDYFFNIVKGFMDLPGFRVYRQDFNFMPLDWWRHTDAPDRQGITEMKYIEGLYAYWDRIAQTWPDSLREECASGGMRIDLETVKRMHIHQKTDYWFDNEADQAHLFGLSQYLPNGVVVGNVNRLDDYSFRSSIASSLCLGWIADDPQFDMARGRKLLGRYLELRHLFNGDWYPVLPYTLNPTEWMASQYNRPDLGEGVVVAFRHAASAYPTAELKLRGLDPAAQYELTYDTAAKKTTVSGADLMKGFLLTIPERHGSELVAYKKVK